MSNEIPQKQREIQTFLEQNDLVNAYGVLMYAEVLLNARVSLFKDTANSFRNALLSIPLHGPLPDQAAHLHILQLDLVSKLFTLIEDYLSYSSLLSKPMENLHESIASNLGFDLIWKEVRRLEGMTSVEIATYLRLPDTNLLSITPEEKRFVQEILENYVCEFHQRIQRLAKFVNKYNRVYMKYKHIFPAIIGLFNKRRDGTISSEIYIRDYTKLKGESHICKSTYILPTDLLVLNYYEDIADDVRRLFQAILATTTQYLQNLRKPFLVMDAYFIPDDKRQRWREVVTKVNFSTDAMHAVTINLKFDLDTSREIYKGFGTDFIYELKRDIMMGGEFKTRHIPLDRHPYGYE